MDMGNAVQRQQQWKVFVYKLKKPEQSNAAYCAEGEELTLNDDDNLGDS